MSQAQGPTAMLLDQLFAAVATAHGSVVTIKRVLGGFIASSCGKEGKPGRDAHQALLSLRDVCLDDAQANSTAALELLRVRRGIVDTLQGAKEGTHAEA